MALKKVLGLDIGTTSVGWAVSKQTKEDAWTIDDFGVRIFNEPVDVKKSSSFASERRAFRSKRRLIRRKIRRIRDLKYYLQKYGSIKVEQIDDHFLKLKDKNQNRNYKYSDDVNPYLIRKMAIDGKPITWLQFAIALINIAKRRGYDDSFITKSINSEEIKNDNSYADKINLGRKLINEYKYPIIALENLKIFIDRNKNNDSLLNKEYKYVRNTEPNKKYINDENNRSHDFFYFSRADYFNEVKEIIKKQEKHLNLSKDLIKRLIGPDENEPQDKALSIIFRQRPFEDGPGKKDDKNRKYKGFSQDNVGTDIFLNEKRMWSSLIINDLFILLNEISKIIASYEIKEEDLIKFNQSMILKYFECALKDSKTFKKIFLLCVSNFNIEKQDSDFKIWQNLKITNLFIKKLSEFLNDEFLKKGLEEIRQFVFDKNKNFDAIETNKFILDKFGNLIAENITPWLLLQKLKEENFYNQFDENKIDNYFNDKTKKNKINFKDLDEKINYAVSQFSTSPSKVSYKYACMALHDFIFKGKKYGDFQAEFNKSSIINNKSIVKTPFGPICDPDVSKNPMVMRALSQARKVVKELYKKYKWFDSIVVESARDLTSSLKDRRKIKESQDKNYNENLEISDILEKNKLLNNNVNKRKLKLYNRQKGFSIYSGKPIDISRLDDYEIDHIIPQSKINDDSFDNTVLVSKEENQIKKNRTPLEAGIQLIQDEKVYKSRCLKLRKEGLISERKYILLTAKSTDSQSVKNIIEQIASRELNDTRYISKYFTNYLKKSIELYCEKNPEYQKYNHSKVVFNPTGTLTSGYRKAWLYDSPWGLEIKTRDISHFHHAVDAIILSNMVSESRIKFYTDCLRIWNLFKDKNKKNLTENKIEELDTTYKEILASWENQKNFMAFDFLDIKEKFEDIKNMKFTSFAQIAPPIVGLRNLKLHVDERIPVKLSIEKKEKNLRDSDNNEKIVNYYAPKLEKIIWEEEYNKTEEINRLKKLFPESNIRYPFISYKQNNKIKGDFTGSENYVGRNSIELKRFINDEETKNNGYKILDEKGILDIRNYYGVLVLKSSNDKFDFIKIKKFDIINKFKSKINQLKSNNLKAININDICNDFFIDYISNKSEEHNSKILMILCPGTIFSGIDKNGERIICVYTGLSNNRIRAPYIFVPLKNYREIAGHYPVYSKFSLLDMKILKIDILGRKLN